MTRLHTDLALIELAAAVHGKGPASPPDSKMTSSRELPMPNTTRITSLDQSHALLLLCWTKLSKFTQEQTPTRSFAWSPTSVCNERQLFQGWLERWEIAFSSYLSSAISSMSNDELLQSRVLKTNHLACTILASDSTSAAFDTFEAEFRAIIELAGAVLRSRHVSDSPQDTKAANKDNDSKSPGTAGLDVREPLLVVMSHCGQESLRIRANELLTIFYQ